VIEAIISGLCVAIPSIIATIVINNKNQALTNYKIDELSDRVNKHNSLVERMFKCEEKIALLENDVKDIKEARK
jgi:hypothetical protein